jgi:DNA-binding transcriptional LysR family regulator
MEHPPLVADLGEIITFTRVVQGGSFTAAASRLGMPKSTVSRKIAELETRIGARLLQRTTRTVSLTDVGLIYYEHCLRVVSELEEAEQAVARAQATPRGKLRVTAPLTFSVFGPILAEYLDLYPEVKVELVCTDRRVDLIEERFDLALRAGPSPDSSLVAQKVGQIRRCLFAAPALIERTGRLAHPRELEGKPCVVFAPEGNTWTLSSGSKKVQVNLQPRLVVNDYDMLRATVRAGFGFALLPEHQCLEDVAAGRLACLLPAWETRDVPVFALYPSTRHLSPKVVALVDLIRDRLAKRIAGAAS